MKEFAVIGLDTQEKKAEAERLLKELGYVNDEEWNETRRTIPSKGVIVVYGSGTYHFYERQATSYTEITLDQLREKVGKTEAVEEPKYPCMMEVWNSHEEYSCELEVISEVEYNGVKGFLVYNEAYGDFYSYKNARPIQPDPIKEVVEDMKRQVCWKSSFGVVLTPNEAQLIIDALEKNEK
jgi:hypothetical protein